ncbi:hypothetical protein IIC65_05275, partial [Candidatus Sumerlaeota bacterium]|nr:hypothetical protein [Candidatus Sumerlaeota bacterium]
PYGAPGSPSGPNSSPPAGVGAGGAASGRVIDLASAGTRFFSVSFGGKTSVEDFLLLPWSPRDLISESTFPFSGGVEVSEPIQWDRVRDQLDGVLVNATPWTFKRWWLCRGPKIWLGNDPLPPGSEADLSRLTSQRVHLPGEIGEALMETFLKPPNRDEPSRPPQGNLPTVAGVQGVRFPSGAGTLPLPAGTRQFTGVTPGGAGALPIQTGEVQERAFWSRLGLGREMSPSHIGFTFFGQAERSVSTLLSRFKPDESLGLLFYLEDLSDPVIRSPPSGMNWTLFLSLTGQFESAWPVHSLHTPAANERLPGLQGLRSGFVSFPAAQVSIYLVPQILPFWPTEDATATIGFVLTSDPKDHPYGPPDQPDRSFKVAGCPVSVYNARADIWDDLGVWTGGPMTLSPLSDYLDPETSSVHLRIDASPDEIRWTVLEAARDDPVEMIKGADLFGAFGPGSKPYRLGEDTIYPPQLQLEDFTVSFSAPG